LLPISPVWKQLRRKRQQEKSLKYALPHYFNFCLYSLLSWV
jgi:hypothetical protein